VFVNPFSGKGTAKTIWEKVKILFEIGDVDVKLIETTHAGHAQSVVNTSDLSQVGGLVTVGGDGILYEVLNGLLQRKDWNKVRRIPLGPIPGG
jgi:sphingosine kinase